MGALMTARLKKAAPLAAAAARVASVLPARSVTPGRRCVALEARDDRLILAGTNLEQAVEVQLPAEVETPGQTLVNGAMFADSVALAGDAEVVLTAEGPRLRIEAGGARWSLLVVADEFAAHGLLDCAGVPLRLDAKRFEVAIGQVDYAVDAGRDWPARGGVHLVGAPDEPLRLEATDGHRAALARCPVLLSSPWTGEAIVARALLRPLRAALRTAAEVEVFLTPSTATFRVGSETFGTRLLEGVFPDIARVVPSDSPWRVELNAPAVVMAVRRALVLAEPRTPHVYLRFAPGEGLRVSASHADLGDAEAHVAADWPGPEECAITVNGQYLLDFLAGLEVPTFSLSVKDPWRPLLLEADPTPIGVVVPIRR